MRKHKLLWLAPLLLLPFAWDPIERTDGARSVRPYVAQMLAGSSQFDAAQSVGLFVGIPRFKYDQSLTVVRFAADDAVDLAYAFTIDAKAPLVRPARVVIAISDDPQKDDSRKRLKELQDAGAKIVKEVDQPDLIKLLQDQAALVGRDGMFIVSLATHGFNEDGIPYLLGASSFFSRRSTALSGAEIAEIVASSEAKRSLIFFDACRERVRDDSRSGALDPRSQAPFIEKMVRVEGHVIFYAAAPGGYAYDDEERGNGVFTAAVIDALECESGSKPVMITVDQLATRVEKQVRKFLLTRDRSVKKATQISMEGSTGRMPLMLCRTPWPPPAPEQRIASVQFREAILEGFDDRGTSLWKRPFAGTITNAVVEPLFGNDTRYAVVLSVDGTTSRLSIYDGAGEVLGSYEHEGPLRYLAVAKPTGRYHPRIVAAGSRIADSFPIVLVINPKEIGRGASWYGAIGDARQTITNLTIDGDRAGRSIVLSMSKGDPITLDFKGNVIQPSRNAPLIVTRR